MASLMKKAIYPITGLLVFGVSLVAFLIWNGQLSAEYLPFGGQPAPPAAESADDGHALVMRATRHFSADELNELLYEARRVRTDVENESRRLADQEARIAIARQDLERERGELMLLRGQIDLRHEELRAARGELDGRIHEIEEVEVAGLRRSASVYSAMEARKAAAAIELLEVDQAAKLLAFIDEKKVARILQEMTPAMATELMNEVRKVKAPVQ